MNYLLDTCTFLWLTGQSGKLSKKARQICTDTDNGLFLSSISVWEIEVKYRLGRLLLANDPAYYIPVQRENHLIYELPFEEKAALQHSLLATIHKDPFDRMLVCQAREHQLTLLTPDKHIASYGVPTIW